MFDSEQATEKDLEAWKRGGCKAGEGALIYEPKEPPSLSEVAERMGVSIAFSPFAGSHLGATSTDGTQVTLNSHDLRTWFHELGHAVHAKCNGKLKGGQDEHQEVVAELAAAVLMELYGYGDISGSSWRYVSQYSADPLRAIMKAAEDVGQILGVIFDGEVAEHDAI